MKIWDVGREDTLSFTVQGRGEECKTRQPEKQPCLQRFREGGRSCDRSPTTICSLFYGHRECTLLDPLYCMGPSAGVVLVQQDGCGIT